MRQRITLQQWLKEQGDVIPLRMAPDVVMRDPATVRRWIERGLVNVMTFRSIDGQLRRYVRVDELKQLVRPPKLTVQGMTMAIQRMLDDDTPAVLRQPMRKRETWRDRAA